jgi:hypothetical protein
MGSKYWILKLPKVKDGKDFKRLSKRIKKLYAGELSKKEIIKDSAYVQVAKGLNLPKSEQKEIAETVWREYKGYKKFIGKR